MSERQRQRIERLANNSISQMQVDEAGLQLDMLTAPSAAGGTPPSPGQAGLERVELHAPTNKCPPPCPERDATDALVVPRNAIAIRQTGNYLMRIRRDNTVERVAITLRGSLKPPPTAASIYS